MTKDESIYYEIRLYRYGWTRRFGDVTGDYWVNPQHDYILKGSAKRAWEQMQSVS